MIKFNELFRIKINNSKTLVISLNENNDLVFAQEIKLPSNKKFFMKNSIIINKSKIHELYLIVGKVIKILINKGIL